MIRAMSLDVAFESLHQIRPNKTRITRMIRTRPNPKQDEARPDLTQWLQTNGVGISSLAASPTPLRFHVLVLVENASRTLMGDYSLGTTSFSYTVNFWLQSSICFSASSLAMP